MTGPPSDIREPQHRRRRIQDDYDDGWWDEGLAPTRSLYPDRRQRETPDVDSMTVGDPLGERRPSVRRGSHAVFHTVFVMAGVLMTFAFVKGLICRVDGVRAKDAWECCGCRK